MGRSLCMLASYEHKKTLTNYTLRK
uniref:Uncharacterized protein n=1 Tax=Anguilla anguilla TaxID=7936 RepID=A0A0E9S5U5_ANGAN